MKQVAWNDKGDLLHQFWLLFQSYKNRETEKENIAPQFLKEIPRQQSSGDQRLENT